MPCTRIFSSRTSVGANASPYLLLNIIYWFFHSLHSSSSSHSLHLSTLEYEHRCSSYIDIHISSYTYINTLLTKIYVPPYASVSHYSMRRCTMQVPHHREEWFQTYFPHLFCIKEDCLSLLLLNCWSRFTFCQCLIVELGLTVVHSGRPRLIYSTKRKRKQKQKQNGYVRDTQGCKWEGGCEHDQNCWFKITEFGIGRYFWSLVLIT